YAAQSVRLKPKDQPDDKIMSLNYYVLGKVSQTRNNTKEALNYFLKADAISNESGDLLNIKDLYQNIIDIYASRADSAKTLEYRDKLKEYELVTLQSKYNSLQKVLSKKDEATPVESDSNKLLLMLSLSGVLVAIAALCIVYIKRRRQKKSAAIEDQQEDTPSTEHYDLLLDMIKRDDSSFIYTFEKLFPDFSKKLLDVCPQLVQTEIEFCALLKMKLSTKQIAQFTFIETRTVQNKKHRIRKKLNIPAEVDIYHWFDDI
ncbi:MAG: hypothetical protein EOP54_30230, partial [Sphingobacteriales bacterium]